MSDFNAEDEYLFDDSEEGSICDTQRQGDAETPPPMGVASSQVTFGEQGCAYQFLAEHQAQELRENDIEKVLRFIGGILSSLRYGPTCNDPDLPGNAEMVEAILTTRDWDCDVTAQDLIENPTRVLKEVGYRVEGFPGKAATPFKSDGQTTFFCPIICDTVNFDETTLLLCGHRVSNEAWRLYLLSRLEESRVMGVKCMLCEDSLPWSVVRDRLGESASLKWRERLLDSFADHNSRVRRCLGPDCSRLVYVLTRRKLRLSGTIGRDYTVPMDVECSGGLGCGTAFCFACAREAHRPIPCEILEAWDRKNTGEADNFTWIFANTKACPLCKNPIEKNQGCMHMTCRCQHEFCWLCMEDWKKHEHVDYFRCNVYESRERDTPQESQRQRAKECVERYAHFYERYRAHNQGQDFAKIKLLGHLDRARSVPSAYSPSHTPARAVCDADGNVAAPEPKIESFKAHITGVFYERMSQAICQIIEGRRMLKFSYAFGFFAEWERGNPAGKELFEHQQGQLEWALDKLQGFAEDFDFDRMALPAKYGDFGTFNRDLTNMTRVVRDFFVRMTEAFESDVVRVALPPRHDLPPHE